jgi:hypothetical protein
MGCYTPHCTFYELPCNGTEQLLLRRRSRKSIPGEIARPPGYTACSRALILCEDTLLYYGCSVRTIRVVALFKADTRGSRV